MQEPRPARLQALAARALHDLAASQSALLVLLGDRLGLYRALWGAGALTADELAERTGFDSRYLAEWLANQAASGWVDYDPEGERFELNAEQAALFADESSRVFQGGAYQLCLALISAAPALERAFRDGTGVAPEVFGEGVRDALRRVSNTRLRASLGSWIGAMPGLVERLERGVRVADVGCGAGAACIWLAHRFPASTFLGLDLDASSIAMARAEAAGLGERVRFETLDARELGEEDISLVLALDVLHESPDAGAIVAAARRALAPEGRLLVAEPHAGDGLASCLHPGGRLLSAVSASYCLPVSRTAEGAGTGALTDAARIRALLARCGFGQIDTLPSAPFELVLDCRA